MKTKKENKSQLKPIIMVVICTLFTSIGQILLKYGSKNLNSVTEIITNVPLIVGFLIYGIAAIILILALRIGDLSVLYPFIALSFIWVTICSIFLFNEHVTLFNWLGIGSIMLGVSMIGIGSMK